MKDTKGRIIVSGDRIVYGTTFDSRVHLSTGTVVSYCENGVDKIRVLTDGTPTDAFLDEYTKPGEEPPSKKQKTVTLSTPNSVLVISSGPSSLGYDHAFSIRGSVSGQRVFLATVLVGVQARVRHARGHGPRRGRS